MLRALRTYLEDPFLNTLYRQIRQAGAIRSISVDITSRCNLRCTGCYYFAEGMDALAAGESEAAFDAFVEREKARGTNFVTVVGGEPSLVLHRLKKLYDNFNISVATNGLRRIPLEGFENLPIGVAVWGDHPTDRWLRGSGKIDVFRKALENYRNDSRAFFYYTVAPGKAHEIPAVVRQCVENGNRVLFNFYSDLHHLGGDMDYHRGFEEVLEAIDRAIEEYPEHILITRYLAEVVTSGRLFDERWGFDVCTSLSVDFPQNQERFTNGKPFNPHFKAYNADFTTTRRCCNGIQRSCEHCFDVWEHFAWVMLNLPKHLFSKDAFTAWLSTMYLFYAINRLVPVEEGLTHLPEIHRRVGWYSDVIAGRDKEQSEKNAFLFQTETLNIAEQVNT